MLRYLRLYLYFLRFSFSRAMEFRVDFFFRVVMDCLFYAVQIAFFFILYQHTNTLGGWNIDQILIFTAAFFLFDALNMTFFSNNFWWLPIFINKGDLDYYLVRPVSSLFFLTLRDFAANSFLNLLIAIGIAVWALGRYPGDLGFLPILLFFALILLGTCVNALIQLCFLIPTFWLHSHMGLWQIYWEVEKYASYPHQIYAPWLRRILTTFIPLALLASIPTHVLFEGLTLAKALGIGGVVAGFFLVTVTFWRLGLRSYASASS